MKQETIEQLRMSAVAWDEGGTIHRPGVLGCAICPGEEWPCATATLQVVWLNTVKTHRYDILAVLEAAQRWAEASRKMEAARGRGDVEIDAVRGVFDTSDALLALFEEPITPEAKP